MDPNHIHIMTGVSYLPSTMKEVIKDFIKHILIIIIKIVQLSITPLKDKEEISQNR